MDQLRQLQDSIQQVKRNFDSMVNQVNQISQELVNSERIVKQLFQQEYSTTQQQFSSNQQSNYGTQQQYRAGNQQQYGSSNPVFGNNPYTAQSTPYNYSRQENQYRSQQGESYFNPKK